MSQSGFHARELLPDADEVAGDEHVDFELRSLGLVERAADRLIGGAHPLGEETVALLRRIPDRDRPLPAE